MDILDIILIIIIFAVYYITKKKFKNTQEEPKNTKIENYPYKKKLLLTKTEYSFYNTLKSLCDSANLIICPKVRMEDFLEVTDKKNFMKYRGYIKSRHIDFMICDSKLQILAGIELDDKSHNSEKSKQTDEFKNKVFKTINIPLYRVKVSNSAYNDQIQKIIQELGPVKISHSAQELVSAKIKNITKESTHTETKSPIKETPQINQTTTKTSIQSNYLTLP